MSSRTAITVFTFTALAAAPVARAASSANFEVLGGWQNLEPTLSSVTRATRGNEGTAILGGDILLRLEGLGVGASVDKTVSGSNGQPWAGALMAGLLFDPVPYARVEVLGEVGRRGGVFEDMFRSAGQTFVGARPGLSFRIWPAALRFGASALIRWPTSGGEFGSPDFALVGRFGFEVP